MDGNFFSLHAFGLLASFHSKRLRYPKTRCAMRTHSHIHPSDGSTMVLCSSQASPGRLGDWGEQGVNLGGPFSWKVAEGCTHFCYRFPQVPACTCSASTCVSGEGGSGSRSTCHRPKHEALGRMDETIGRSLVAAHLIMASIHKQRRPSPEAKAR